MVDNPRNVEDFRPPAPGQQAEQADLSRFSWQQMDSTQRRTEEGNIIDVDRCGRITKLTQPDGIIYEYNKPGPNGQPTEVKITNTKTGDFGQWKREEDGLWRSYRQNAPNQEVIVGEWNVDDQGRMRKTGHQDFRPYPKLTAKDEYGRVDRVDHPDGVSYEFTQRDEMGRPTVAKIMDKKTGDWGYWKKEEEGLWRAYDKEKPTRQVIRGTWAVDVDGNMHLSGTQDFQDVPDRLKPRPALTPEMRDVPPEGYHRMRGQPVTPEMGKMAHDFLWNHGNQKFGTLKEITVDGKEYVMKICAHGEKKGVTIYAKDAPTPPKS